MAATQSTPTSQEIDYPTSDGLPMAETDVHRDDMSDLIETLKVRYFNHPNVYVSGNLLLYYVRGDRRRHVSPDVFVVDGVPKRRRDYYLLWQEAKGPDVAIELTSQSTRTEDLEDKFILYRDVLKVREYFLFDPHAEYLDPPLQGNRLIDGQYLSIEPVNGRLPSEVLGLHLERNGEELRLYDPATDRWLPTPREAVLQAEAARQQEAAARAQAEAGQRQEAAARALAEQARQQIEAEVERLRKSWTPCVASRRTGRELTAPG